MLEAFTLVVNIAICLCAVTSLIITANLACKVAKKIGK